MKGKTLSQQPSAHHDLHHQLDECYSIGRASSSSEWWVKPGTVIHMSLTGYN